MAEPLIPLSMIDIPVAFEPSCSSTLSTSTKVLEPAAMLSDQSGWRFALQPTALTYCAFIFSVVFKITHQVSFLNKACPKVQGFFPSWPVFQSSAGGCRQGRNMPRTAGRRQPLWSASSPRLAALRTASLNETDLAKHHRAASKLWTTYPVP